MPLSQPWPKPTSTGLDVIFNTFYFEIVSEYRTNYCFLIWIGDWIWSSKGKNTYSSPSVLPWSNRTAYQLSPFLFLKIIFWNWSWTGVSNLFSQFWPGIDFWVCRHTSHNSEMSDLSTCLYILLWAAYFHIPKIHVWKLSIKVMLFWSEAFGM